MSKVSDHTNSRIKTLSLCSPFDQYETTEVTSLNSLQYKMESKQPANSTNEHFASSSSTASTRSPPSPLFLTPQDIARNTLSCLGRDGHAMTREEFLSYHSPTNPSVTQTRESLWAITFNRRRESSATHGVSEIYDECTFPLARFELTVLSTHFDGLNLRLMSSLLAVCEDPSDDVVARGEIIDVFYRDPGVDGRYYLVDRSLTFTSVLRPALLERRPRVQLDSNGRMPWIRGSSSRYDMYLRLTYFAMKLRELRQALNPSLGFSALAASIAANPTLSMQVRSGFAVTGTVISSVSCLFFASEILAEVLENKIRPPILDVAPSRQPTRNCLCSDIIGLIVYFKCYWALLVVFAAAAAFITFHTDKNAFGIFGIVVAFLLCLHGIASIVSRRVVSRTALRGTTTATGPPRSKSCEMLLQTALPAKSPEDDGRHEDGPILVKVASQTVGNICTTGNDVNGAA
ncbi:hypothetical protein BT69DRAFT_1321721 [Atractiella rhizophila]|nr:hypothetical protein BT69DRAFT_1321721 [Atractiella rhizophila]